MSYVQILEFGSQTTDRIGTRLSQMGVPVRYGPSHMRIEELSGAAGVVISGGPKGTRDPDAFPYDPRLFDIGKPIFGICYGLQLGGLRYGAGIHRRTKEYGETRVEIVGDDPLLEGFGRSLCGWMNHGDSITPGDFQILGYTEKGVPAIIRRGNFFAVLYHPEVSHTENGTHLLRSWAEKKCCLHTRDAGFDADKFIGEAIAGMKDEVSGDILLAYLSGGVDSTVAAYLAKLAGLKMKCTYLENGFGRNNEAKLAREIIARHIGEELYIVDESDRFLSAVSAVQDSEAKRKAFQRVYNESRKRVEHEQHRDTVLFDGTLVTDTRESGKEAGTTMCGATVDTIKTHHNTEWKGRKVSPLAGLTKEQVRAVARRLGLPPEVSERPPFPGPGLSVRFPTAYYPASQELFYIAKQMAREYGMDAFVLPRKGVGLKGDSRALEHIAVLSGERDWTNIRKAGKRLIEELDICRVVYLVDRIHPVGTHLFDSDFNKAVPFPLTRENLDRLRDVTEIAEKTTADYGVRYSQMPVFAIGGPSGWINVVRDVDSEDFRTVRPLRKPDEFPWECCDEIEKRLWGKFGEFKGLTAAEVSDKPGGTTELE